MAITIGSISFFIFYFFSSDFSVTVWCENWKVQKQINK